jgi:hypothetical protein
MDEGDEVEVGERRERAAGRGERKERRGTKPFLSARWLLVSCPSSFKKRTTPNLQ